MMDPSPVVVGHGSLNGGIPEVRSQHMCLYPSGSVVLHSPEKSLQSAEKAVKGSRRVVQGVRHPSLLHASYMPCVADFALLRSAL